MKKEESALPPASAAHGEGDQIQITCHRLPDRTLLPPICPSCGASGTQILLVPHAAGVKARVELDAYFCDLCAEAEQQQRTRRLAALAASGLLLLATTTTLALGLGSRLIFLQILITTAIGLALPELILRTRLWATQSRPLEIADVDSSDGSLVLVVRRPPFRRALHELNLVESSLFTKRRDRKRLLIRGALLGLGLTFLLLFHTLGGATVRVVLGGGNGAYLLVDSYHAGHLEPANAEDPRAGLFAHVLGGRRTLGLMSDDGQILADEAMTLWPGRTYIVGHLPAGRCLYWEKRTYGANPQEPLLLPLRGSAPVWELEHRVDSWFVPLVGDNELKDGQDESWDGSGGVRRAIRLLPCRGLGLDEH